MNNLEKLVNDIPWQTIEHAECSSCVREILLKLIRLRDEDARYCAAGIEDASCRNRELHAVAYYVVPVLINLLETASFTLKRVLLRCLFDILDGQADVENTIRIGVAIGIDKICPPEMACDVPLQLACHHAVLMGVSIYRDLLICEDPECRRLAALLLSQDRDTCFLMIDDFLVALKTETDERVRGILEEALKEG